MATSWNKRLPDVELPAHEEIILMIIDRLNSHTPKYQIAKWLMWESGYNYGKTHSYNLINEAQDTITEVYKETARVSLEDRLNGLQTDRAEAIQRGEHRLAFDIDKEINKILGLYKERIDLSGGLDFITSFGH